MHGQSRTASTSEQKAGAGAAAERIEAGDREALATDDLDEDLKEFYPPPELKDWKRGLAVANTAIQESIERVGVIEQMMVIQGITPQEKPQDE